MCNHVKNKEVASINRKISHLVMADQNTAVQLEETVHQQGILCPILKLIKIKNTRGDQRNRRDSE